jgi:hypothetical protein
MGATEFVMETKFFRQTLLLETLMWEEIKGNLHK